MTAKRKRLEALEAAHARRLAGVRRAFLSGLSVRELEDLYAALLAAEGHPDPGGEAARRRAEIHAMTTAELLALAGSRERRAR